MNVNVNVPAVVVLMVAGLQVPVMPFNEVPGSAGAAEFWQSGPISVNVGVTEVNGNHSSRDAALSRVIRGERKCECTGSSGIDGSRAQVPVMPFNEVPGSAGAAEFWHSGPIAVNVGVT